MIGYHLTSYDNWVRIKYQGLIPYPFARHLNEFKRFCKEANIIFLWNIKPVGKDLLGCIIDRVMGLHNEHIVMLEVQYSGDDTINKNVEPYDVAVFTHKGDIGHPCRDDAWVYHEYNEVILLKSTIPPSRLKLIGQYNLLDMLERNTD